LIEPTDPEERRWRAMVNASKAVRAGAKLALDRAPEVSLEVVAEEGEGFVVIDAAAYDARQLAHRYGEIPLPPYLGRKAEESDKLRYQTVFARGDAEGSVAAPTAGLHFTP